MNTSSLTKDLLSVLAKHAVTNQATFDNFKNILQQVLQFLETLIISGTASLKIDEKETIDFLGSTYALGETLNVTGTKQ